MAHDFDSQRRDTEATFAELSRRVSVPDTIDLDLHFVAENPEADVGGFVRAARAAGFGVEIYDDQSTVELQTPLDAPDAERIWHVERRATELALDHGLTPDGWGFAAAMANPLRGLAARLSGLFARG